MFTRLRWLTIILPVAFVLVVEGLSDTVLDETLPFPVDTILVGLAVLLAALTMTTLAFRQIDRLSAELRERNAELEGRNARARALHAMTVAVTGLGDIDAVLRRTADDARELLGTDVALLTLAGRSGDEAIAATSGPEEAFDTSGGGGSADSSESPRRFVRSPFETSFLSVPLQRGSATIGHLAVASRAAMTRQVDDLETLGSLANQASIAIENDRLQRELRALALRAERERIAREMHDGLAQVLGYVNAKSQAVEELLGAGRTDEARAQMAELATAARSIYVDVREAILGLTTPLGPGAEGTPRTSSDLEAAVRTYAHRFADAAKLAVEVEALGLDDAPELSPEAIANLLRIVQEALTNVRKHAAAKRVLVRLEGIAGGVAVSVEDDGRGFDPAAPEAASDWPHFGRQTIRERAAAIGGTAAWDSAPGRGTRFRVTVPATAGGMSLRANPAR